MKVIGQKMIHTGEVVRKLWKFERTSTQVRKTFENPREGKQFHAVPLVRFDDDGARHVFFVSWFFLAYGLS